jgi:serine/threonine-protein kinase RsbW
MAAVPGSADISLAIPGRPEYGRVARVGAAHLAHRRGFTLGEIDDLRMAIDEAVIMLLGPSPRPGRIEIEYRLGPAVVDVELVSRLDEKPGPLPDNRITRFREITVGLADDITVNADARSVRVLKRHATPHG